MHRFLPLAIIISVLATPAYADTFQSLQVEQSTLFQKIIRGGASAADVARFKIVTAQIRSLANSEFSNHANQLKSMMNSMNVIQDQQNDIHKTLFGGVESQAITDPPVSKTPMADKAYTEYSSKHASVQPGQNTAPSSLQLTSPSPDGSIRLVGSVQVIDFDKVVDVALENSDDFQEVKKAMAKYNTPLEKLKSFTAETTTFFIPYRGFSQSRDGAKVFLGEDTKVNSISSAQLKEIQVTDVIHLKLVTALLQVASSIGKDDEQAAEKGMPHLRLMLGEDQAEALKMQLEACKGESNGGFVPMDVMQAKEHYDKVLDTAVFHDVLIQGILQKIRKMKPSDRSMLVSRIASPTLGILEMGPWFVGVPARGAFAGYSMATGGQESTKLLKEIYLGKALEDRVTLISEEVHIVLDNYNDALRNNNGPLLVATRTLLDQMVGVESKL